MVKQLIAACLFLLVSSPTFAQMVPDLCPSSPNNVAAGQTVTITGSTTTDCMANAGTVLIADNTTWRVTTLQFYAGGRIDTVNHPAVNVHVILRNAPIDTQADPEQWGHGIVGEGTIRLEGVLKTTFLRLASEPRAGQSTLTLNAPPAGWNPGDTVVVPDSRHLRDGVQFNYAGLQIEVMTIASVVGATVTLTAPLKYDHLGARSAAGVLEYLPFVMNTTRSVVVESESPTGVRGHTLFTGRANVTLKYVEFKDLGRTTTAPLDCTLRANGSQADSSAAGTQSNCTTGTGAVTHVGTNQIGRYAIHFHHLSGPAGLPAGTPQFTAIGNAIEHTPKWGIAVHDSHYGLVQDNVGFDNKGAGVMTEDGSETANVIDHNYIIGSTGTGGREGGGREGGCFYFRGVNNYVRNNMCADVISDTGEAGYAYKFFQEYLGNIKVPKFAGADVMDPAQVNVVDAYALPIRQFADNEAGGAIDSCLTYWWVGSEANHPRDNGQVNTIKNLTCWHIHDKGIYNYDASHMRIDHFVMRGGDPTNAACCGYGFYGGDYYADDLELINPDIQGMTTGVVFSENGGRTTQRLTGGTLQNYTNILTQTMHTSAYKTTDIPPRRVTIDGTKLLAPPAKSGFPYAAVRFVYNDQPTRALVRPDSMTATNYNGVAGSNVEFFFKQQAPSFVVPKSIFNADGTFSLEAAPAAGLTNLQTTPIGGKVASCSTTSPDIVDGFICGNAAPSPPPPPPPPPPQMPGDITGPTVTFTAPKNGDTVAGVVQITVGAQDPSGVASVRFTIDGVGHGTLTAPPFVSGWTTTNFAPGSHTLGATATDTAGNATTATIAVSVANGSTPPPPPPAPIDCVVSAWSAWMPIDATTEQRTRTIVTAPANGGVACPALSETRAIAVPPPPTPSATVTVMVATTSCTVKLVGSPPDTLTGWKVQYRREDATAFGTARTASSAYTVTGSVTPGAHAFTATWTRTGSATVTLPVSVTCR